MSTSGTAEAVSGSVRALLGKESAPALGADSTRDEVSDDEGLPPGLSHDADQEEGGDDAPAEEEALPVKRRKGPKTHNPDALNRGKGSSHSKTKKAHPKVPERSVVMEEEEEDGEDQTEEGVHRKHKKSLASKKKSKKDKRGLSASISALRKKSAGSVPGADESAPQKRKMRFYPGFRVKNRILRLQRDTDSFITFSSARRNLAATLNELIHTAGNKDLQTRFGIKSTFTTSELGKVRDMPRISPDALHSTREYVSSELDGVLRACALVCVRSGKKRATADDLYTVLKIRGMPDDAEAVQHLMDRPADYAPLVSRKRSRADGQKHGKKVRA